MRHNLSPYQKDKLCGNLRNHCYQYKKIFSGKYIDVHKLSSLLICAILNVGLMEYKQSGDFLVRREGVSCNEIYSIICAVCLLKIVILSDLRTSKKYSMEYIQKSQKDPLLLPKIANIKEENLKKIPYLMYLAKDIYTFRHSSEAEISIRLTPILFHVFFFIEKFHTKAFNENYYAKHTTD